MLKWSEIVFSPLKININSGNIRLVFLWMLTSSFFYAIFIHYPISELIEYFVGIRLKKELEPNDGLVAFVFSGIVIAPLIEECAFRLPLKTESNRNILPFIVLLALSYFATDLLTRIVLISFLSYLIIGSKLGKGDTKKRQILLSAVAFSLIHVDNFDYPDSAVSYLFVPFIISTHLIIGIYLGAIRFHRFYMSLLLHSGYNGLLLILYFIFNH